MRTFGLAGAPLLPELAHSDSAGERLAAIAMLQVNPKVEYAKWLGDPVAVEHPFVGYQAAVALQSAARVLDDHERRELRDVVQATKTTVARRQGTDRWKVLENAERELSDR